MAGGFFQERKHYRLYEISKEYKITLEEARSLVGILRKYGVIKVVKASKPEYEDLSNQDIVLTDVPGNSTDAEYVFDFVGVVMVDEYVFKCYPKYILSTTEPMQQLKQVLKVIKKYNDKEQVVYLYNGEDDSRIFNRLAVSLHLLEDYFQYGVYTNQHEVIETNGEGEILWDKTINETFALLKNNYPYYVELQTQSLVDNEMDYIRRLHECVLSQCSAELKEAGLLDLFDIAEVELTNAQLDDFGDVDYIKYCLEREIQIQFITRKQTLLKTLYTYIANDKVNQEGIKYSLYGTNSFHLVWEKVCAENFGNVLDKKISSLPLGVVSEYESKKDESLRSLLDKPVWHRNNPIAVDDKTDTLRPDLICVYPCNDQMDYCFGIYDAKYYCIDFEYQKNEWKVKGQPGVGDVTKQYLYQLAYDDFIVKQGYRYVQNMFLCPHEKAETDYGYVSMEMLHRIGNKNLENIAVVKLCAEEMYDIYLSGRSVSQDKISKYIPEAGRQSVKSHNFADRMMTYLSKITNLSWEDEKKLGIKTEKGKLIYPPQIKRELGAKIIYDLICPIAIRTFYRFNPYEQELGSMEDDDMGKSFQRCIQLADAALEIEKKIKGLLEQDLRNETVIKAILIQCFEGKSEISAMASGNSLDMIAEKIMEMIRGVYL